MGKASGKDTPVSKKIAKAAKAAKKTAKPSPASPADKQKTKDQLIAELQGLRRKAARLEREKEKQKAPLASSYLDALLKHSSDYILISDSNGLPVLFNDAYKKAMKAILGITMKPGLQPHKLLPDKEEVAWWDNIHKRALNGETFHVGYSIPVPG